RCQPNDTKHHKITVSKPIICLSARFLKKEAMNTNELDAKIALLQDNKDRWATLPLRKKVEMAKRLIDANIAVGKRQIQAAIKAKQIPADSPLVGEEWLGGPLITVRNLRLLVNSLEQVITRGTPTLPPEAVHTRPDGQTVV